jgi:PQQ-like domain
MFIAHLLGRTIRVEADLVDQLFNSSEKRLARRPQVDSRYSTDHNGEETNTRGICPSTIGTKNANPAAYSPLTDLFYVPVTDICMDYEPFRVTYAAGKPYTGAETSVYPPSRETEMGGFIAWNAKVGKIIWSNKEPFAVASGALATAGGVVFYGTLEGYLKAVDAKSGRDLYKFKTLSGIIGNVMTYEHQGQATCGSIVGRRRLGRRRLDRRPDAFDGGRQFPRSLCRTIEVYDARRTAHGFCFAMTIMEMRANTRTAADVTEFF